MKLIDIFQSLSIVSEDAKEEAGSGRQVYAQAAAKSKKEGVVLHVNKDKKTRKMYVSDFYDYDETVATFNKGQLEEGMMKTKKVEDAQYFVTVGTGKKFDLFTERGFPSFEAARKFVRSSLSAIQNDRDSDTDDADDEAEQLENAEIMSGKELKKKYPKLFEGKEQQLAQVRKDYKNAMLWVNAPKNEVPDHERAKWERLASKLRDHAKKQFKVDLNEGFVDDGMIPLSYKPAKGDKIEAYGRKGMKNTMWRKCFKSADEMSKWCEDNDATVEGQRDLDKGEMK